MRAFLFFRLNFQLDSVCVMYFIVFRVLHLALTIVSIFQLAQRATLHECRIMHQTRGECWKLIWSTEIKCIPSSYVTKGARCGRTVFSDLSSNDENVAGTLSSSLEIKMRLSESCFHLLFFAVAVKTILKWRRRPECRHVATLAINSMQSLQYKVRKLVCVRSPTPHFAYSGYWHLGCGL